MLVVKSPGILECSRPNGVSRIVSRSRVKERREEPSSSEKSGTPALGQDKLYRKASA